MFWEKNIRKRYRKKIKNFHFSLTLDPDADQDQHWGKLLNPDPDPHWDQCGSKTLVFAPELFDTVYCLRIPTANIYLSTCLWHPQHILPVLWSFVPFPILFLFSIRSHDTVPLSVFVSFWASLTHIRNCLYGSDPDLSINKQKYRKTFVSIDLRLLYDLLSCYLWSL